MKPGQIATVAVAILAVAIWMIVIDGGPGETSNKPRATRPSHPPLSSCELFAAPAAYWCRNGRGYIIQDGEWQDIGPLTAIPGVPHR